MLREAKMWTRSACDSITMSSFKPKACVGFSSCLILVNLSKLMGLVFRQLVLYFNNAGGTHSDRLGQKPSYSPFNLFGLVVNHCSIKFEILAKVHTTVSHHTLQCLLAAVLNS